MIRRLTDPPANLLADLAALHASAFAEQERGWSPEEIADLASRGALLADDAGRGFALISVAADEAELLTIAVAAEARRSGLGRALLAAATAAARDAGAERLFLEVADDNAPARALYAGEGFEEVGRRRRYYNRPEGAADALVMARPLTA